MIYLDNAATSFPKPNGMAEAMLEYMVSRCGNPGRAGHRMSRNAAAEIAGVREELADFIGAGDASRVIFTQNATAALNLAIHGLLKKGAHVITTSMEHNSVLRPIIASGADYTIVPCGSDGSLDVSRVEAAIRSNTRLIACTQASNVTGTIMPVGKLADVCRKHNAARRHGGSGYAAASKRDFNELLLLVDASQSVGHIPVSVEGIDLLAAPGHKGLLGPMGTGFLYVRPGLVVKPVTQGGTGTYSKLPDLPLDMCTVSRPESSGYVKEPPLEFPESFEAGTLNAPAIIGLGYSLRYLKRAGRCDMELTRVLDENLRNMKGITVYGTSDCRKKVGIVTFNVFGRDPAEVSSLLDDSFGIATRAGFHCAGLAHKTIGTWDTGAVRMSIGAFNNMRQIRLAVDAVYKISKLGRGVLPPAGTTGCRR